MSPNFSRLPEGFSFHPSGRSGSICYRRKNKILELYWEMSGVPQYDILLWIGDIQTWTQPENERIEETELDEIMTELEAWFRKVNIRSDAFPVHSLPNLTSGRNRLP
jgi:hypothetical protein